MMEGSTHFKMFLLISVYIALRSETIQLQLRSIKSVALLWIFNCVGRLVYFVAPVATPCPLAPTSCHTFEILRIMKTHISIT